MKQLLLICIAVALSMTSGLASVVSGPVSYNGHEYYVVSSQNWSAADAEANALGGYLVAVNDSAEQVFINSFIGGGSHWMGFTDQTAEGTWVWTSNDPVTYTNWNGPYEPNNYGNEDCGAIEVAWGGKWNDLPCDRVHPAIVEVDPTVQAGDLALWLRADLGANVVAGTVASWEDQSGWGRNATQGSVSLQPTYIVSNPAVAGQPTLRFDHDRLSFNGSFIAGSDYTVFVVNGRNSYGVANFYLAGATIGQNRNLVLGYERPDLLRQAHFANDLDAVVEPYQGSPIWALDVFRFSQQDGRAIYRWGTKVASDARTEPLTGWSGSNIGSFPAFSFWFGGDIAEIMIYTSALPCSERVTIASALAIKYDLPYTIEACDDVDSDGDGVPDNLDVCPGYDDNLDLDGDTVPDGCDLCQGDDATGDTDLDLHCDDVDNCPEDANPLQADLDQDGIGDLCEADSDGDGLIDDLDNCPDDPNPSQADSDMDLIGDVCDEDDDNDGVLDLEDNCVFVPNTDQADFDLDGSGDACDGDDDADDILDEDDLCPGTSLGVVHDSNGCSGEQYVTLICIDDCEHPEHGAYVSCVAHASKDAANNGLLTNKQRAAVVRTAARECCNCG